MLEIDPRGEEEPFQHIYTKKYNKDLTIFEIETQTILNVFRTPSVSSLRVFKFFFPSRLNLITVIIIIYIITIFTLNHTHHDAATSK